jgi:WD40 repeat protein
MLPMSCRREGKAADDRLCGESHGVNVRMTTVGILFRRLLVSGVAVALIGGAVPRDASASSSAGPVDVSEDGRVILAQTGDRLSIWDLETKALLGQVPNAGCAQVLLLKQEGWVLCAAYAVTIYDWKHRSAVAAIPAEGRTPMRILAYSRETDRIVVRQGDDAVSVWKIGDKLMPLKHIAVPTGKGPVSYAASPDTKRLAIAQGHRIHLHDLTGTATRDLTVKDGTLEGVLFAPDNSTLAASVGHTIVLIDTAEGSVQGRATLPSAEGVRGHLMPRAFSKDSRRLVAGNGTWSYPVFDVETGMLESLTEFTSADRRIGASSRPHPYAVDISDDADYLVGQPETSNALRIWDLRTGALLSELCGEECRGARPRVSLLKWLPSGSKIVVGMEGGLNADIDGKISVWDVPSRSPELVLDPGRPRATVLPKRAAAPAGAAEAPPALVHLSAVRAVACSPTSSLLVTTGDDGLLKVWDAAQGVLLRQLALSSPGVALAFSADGMILAAGTAQGHIRLWDTRSWREFPPYASRRGRLTALQFLPGARFLVVAGRQGPVSVLDLTTHAVVKELVSAGVSSACGKKDCAKQRPAEDADGDTLSLLDGTPFLLTASGTDRVVWDLRTWREVDTPSGLPDLWSGLGWNRPFVSTTIRTGDSDALTLALWDGRRNGVMARLDTFTHRETDVDMGTAIGLGTSVAVDPSHRWAATRVGDTVSIWDLSALTKRKAFRLNAPAQLHWTGDGKYVIVPTHDRKILVWSADIMEPAHYLRDPAVTK